MAARSERPSHSPRRGVQPAVKARAVVTGLLLAVACGRGDRDGAHARAADVVSSPDGNPIVYETHGKGPVALVFVHGWSSDRSYWSEQVEAFARDHQVVTIDLAGHGESGMGREAWTIPAFGADVAAVVDELKLQRIIFIGHSMGGDVIVEAARHSPERVAGLVWVDAHKSLGTPRTAAEVEAMVAPMRADFRGTVRGLVSMLFGPRADSALVERVRADMSSAPRRVAIPTARAALSFEPELLPQLRDLKVPVVAINPDNMPTDTAALARYGVTVVIVPGSGHFLMLEDPEGFNRALRAVVTNLVDGAHDPTR